jgi:BioD-like phosphotransacetylase family protein
MPLLQVVSSRPSAGKSAVAAGLALGFARHGARVRLLRAGFGQAADEDAESFAELPFVSSPGTPVALDQIGPATDETVVVESDMDQAVTAGLPSLIVVRDAPYAEDANLAAMLREQLVGTIATRIGGDDVERVARDLTNSGLRPLAILPEDRVLAAPSVGEIRDTLGAQVLYDGENGNAVVEDIVIGPVYADPAQPHFHRFASKAILTPFNKTDLLLAAIESQAACLVITGGLLPSPYVADRAQGEETTVMLAPEETPETVTSLADIWFTSRFRGGRKAEAAYALLEARLDFESLARKLQS